MYASPVVQILKILDITDLSDVAVISVFRLKLILLGTVREHILTI